MRRGTGDAGGNALSDFCLVTCARKRSAWFPDTSRAPARSRARAGMGALLSAHYGSVSRVWRGGFIRLPASLHPGQAGGPGQFKRPLALPTEDNRAKRSSKIYVVPRVPYAHRTSQEGPEGGDGREAGRPDPRGAAPRLATHATTVGRHPSTRRTSRRDRCPRRSARTAARRAGRAR